jgi:hypothetical protein
MTIGSGERIIKLKRINKILWITSAIGAGVFVTAFSWHQTKAGLGEFWGWNPTVEIVFQLVIFLSAWLTQCALLTLFILNLVKRHQAKPIQEFTKANKYRSLRKLSLWIAAIPGLVLSPFLITLAISPLIQSTGTVPNILGQIFNYFAGLTFISLVPGAIAMLTLLVLAIIKANQKPIDPKSPTPNLPLTQILIAAITAAMPAIAFLSIWLNAFKECQTNCFIFNDPIMIPLAFAYVALWLAQAIIWLGNRNKLAT